jgi:type IV secretion system protein VirD4
LKKTKMKIMLFIFLSLIGLIIGFFFAGYINLLLSGGNIDDIAMLKPAALAMSIATDERHRLLTLCLCFVIVTGIAALMLTSRRETFESDTIAVADAIKTPVAIGQGQHGTARWLKPAERKETFSLYLLSSEDTIFAALLDAGAHDRKEVRKYADEPAETDDADPCAQTYGTAPRAETAKAAAADQDE